MQGASGLIGPNAILQLLQVLESVGGPEASAGILAAAGLRDMPDGERMIPEGEAARLHRQIRQSDPDRAPALLAQAGRGTADYILAHRIPAPARLLLRALPMGISAHLLSRAIARHAWTFVGSGQFRVEDPWTYEIAGNPLVAGETSAGCLCYWHAAVFARLYGQLVSKGANCAETRCAAQGRDDICRFEIRV
ncbi:MAG: bacteriochlorophyll 4-vinyl reductase [Sulfitobacter sp.]|nr:bacteriochlorophyll 4-vinyl reductase [Sulfitobacter sp.]